MANLSITLNCNLQCKYCFAKVVDVKETEMSRNTFIDSINFLKRSNINQIRLLGGEPTLHPDFPWFLNKSIDEGLKLILFSNGLMPESTISLLENYSSEDLMIVITVNQVERLSNTETKIKTHTLERLNRYIKLSYTIQSRNPQLDFLIGLIEKYNLRHSIRLGLAHPCLEENNVYLHAKDHFKVGQNIFEFYKNAKNIGIQLDFDCGFVPCMFPKEFFEISNIPIEKISQCCGSIPDILPDGTAIYCYPLASAHRVLLNSEIDISELNYRLEKPFIPYRLIGIFPDCSSCTLKISNNCVGGCLALGMQRIRSISGNNKILNQAIQSDSNKNNTSVKNNMKKDTCSEVGSEQKRFVIPYVDQPIDFWKELSAEYGEYIKAVYFPLANDLIGSGRPVQPKKYLEEFLSYSYFSNSILLNPVVLNSSISELAEPLLSFLEKFRKEYDLSEVTVTNLGLAKLLKENIPSLHLTASTLMDISTSSQIPMLEGIFDAIVPASRIIRNLQSLKNLRMAFKGKIRILVNEACLPGCTYRVQHFHDMANIDISNPQSLCDDILRKLPWLRLTGSWILPQHMSYFEGLYDEIKLAGRVTLNNPTTYRRVLDSYINMKKLMPNEIGGGPASVVKPLNIEDKFYEKTLNCNHQCHHCNTCNDYYETSLSELASKYEIN